MPQRQHSIREEVESKSMRRCQAVIGIVALGTVAAALAQIKDPGLPRNYAFRPAFISTISAPAGHTELIVFPLSEKAFKIPIRSAKPVAFSPDGKALFGQCTPDPARPDDPIQIGLCRIDLTTGSTTPVAGSLHPFRDDVANFKKDLFDKMLGFTFPNGEPKAIVMKHPEKHPWEYVSVSPDGLRAVATQYGRVELIDIARGTAEPLDDRFFIAAWSPDGKWLAAAEKGENGRTILMDAKDLMSRRVLGNSELDWSPDSRYLLGMKRNDRCGPYSGTLEAIDVDTGKRITIHSSRCQVNQAMTGWVSSEISAK
jgi:WD40 repeat protein